METSARPLRPWMALLATLVVGCSAEESGDTTDIGESFDGGAAGTPTDPASQGGDGAGGTPSPMGAAGESMSPGSAGEGGTGGMPATPSPEPDPADGGSPTPSGGAPNGSAGSSANAGSGGTPGSAGGSAGAAIGVGGSGVGGGASAEGGADAGSGAPGGASNGGTSSGGTLGDVLEQEALAAMPAAWQEHAVVALRGEVYVLGGFNPDATDRVVVYDPSADEWRDVAAFPEVFQHANAAAIDDRIYVAGYYVGASFSDVSGATYAFDPDANDWTPREPMPQGTERSSACVAALDGLMYVFGGANGGAVIDASVYDPEQDSWEVLAPLPEPREHCTAAGIDGRVFIAAGRSGGLSSFVATTLVYDPDVRTYDELEPISTPRGGVAGAALGSRFVVFGGEGNEGTSSGVFPDVEALDTTTGAWEVLPEMLLPRHGLGAAVIDGRIYLPGGATTQGFGAALDHTAAWFE